MGGGGGLSGGAGRDRALHCLDLVDMRAYARRLPSALSGGQQQRVAIARALANDPPLLVADEPTGNLDSHSAAAVFEVLAGLTERGKTLMYVTHVCPPCMSPIYFTHACSPCMSPSLLPRLCLPTI